MGDKKFILFEFHQDGDLQIGPGTVSTGGSGGLEPDEEAEEPDVDLDVEGGSGPSPVGAVLALAVLVGLALALRKLLGGGSGAEEDVVDVAE